MVWSRHCPWTSKESSFARGECKTGIGFEAPDILLPHQTLVRNHEPIRLLPPAGLIQVSVAADISAVAVDEFCVPCERVTLLPSGRSILDGNSFTAIVDSFNLQVFVAGHGAIRCGG